MDHTDATVYAGAVRKVFKQNSAQYPTVRWFAGVPWQVLHPAVDVGRFAAVPPPPPDGVHDMSAARRALVVAGLGSIPSGRHVLLTYSLNLFSYFS